MNAVRRRLSLPSLAALAFQRFDSFTASSLIPRVNSREIKRSTLIAQVPSVSYVCASGTCRLSAAYHEVFNWILLSQVETGTAGVWPRYADRSGNPPNSRPASYRYERPFVHGSALSSVANEAQFGNH
jgi:hypothetical protein